MCPPGLPGKELLLAVYHGLRLQLSHSTGHKLSHGLGVAIVLGRLVLVTPRAIQEEGLVTPRAIQEEGLVTPRAIQEEGLVPNGKCGSARFSLMTHLTLTFHTSGQQSSRREAGGREGRGRGRGQ